MTVPSSVETDVFSIDLVKTDEEGKLLDGAEFSLYDDAEGGEAIALVKTDNGYRVAMEDEGVHHHDCGHRRQGHD